MSKPGILFVLLQLGLKYYVYHSLGLVFINGPVRLVFQIIFLLSILLGGISYFRLDQKMRYRSLFHGSGINFYEAFGTVNQIMLDLIQRECLVSA